MIRDLRDDVALRIAPAGGAVYGDCTRGLGWLDNSRLQHDTPALATGRR